MELLDTAWTNCKGLWYDADGDVQAVTAMVQQAMQYIDEAPTVEARIELIETLNTVSAGKVLLSSVSIFDVYFSLVNYCIACRLEVTMLMDLCMLPTDIC